MASKILTKSLLGLLAIALALLGWRVIAADRELPPLVQPSSLELYATHWCGFCEQAREFFSEHGLTYIEYDIEADAEAHRRFQQLGGKGVPLLHIDQHQVVHGFSVQSYRQAMQ